MSARQSTPERTPVIEPDAIAAPADVVVALVGTSNGSALRSAVAAVRSAVPPALRVLVIHPREIEVEWVRDDASLTLVAQAMSQIDRLPAVATVGPDTYRALFTLANRVGARAAVVLGSDPGAMSSGAVHTLVHPILDQRLDLVAPLYVHGRFEELINSAIVYPLTRALYGKRIRGQIGLDFAFSARVTARWRHADGTAASTSRPVWIIPQALADDLTIGQANLSVRLPPSPSSLELSATLSKVLGSLFVDLERRAPMWQKVRWSEPVPTFGESSAEVEERDAFDVEPFIESFRLAYRNLQDVWGLVLPPATLVELKRLTSTATEQFRMPDELWARIVYDFVLGHRLRAINRDHLLAALTPAYLAWVASYALEIGHGSRAAADDRVERLCLAYEAQKPYLLRRWRWPDRFNP